MQISLIIVTFVVSLVAFSAGVPFKKAENCRKVHVVILDAGSSGTRIHLYKFEQCAQTNGAWKLVDDVAKDNRPGLSAFVKNADQAVGKVKELMQIVATKEEADLRPEVLVKATAGLRMVAKRHPRQAQKILQAIERYLRTQMAAYVHVPEGGVSILPGIKEGSYFWLAANYLSGLLNTTEKYGTVEMGGASEQIAFQISKNLASLLPESHVDSLKVFGKTYKLYAHSHLRFGINEAQLRFYPDIPAGCRDKICLLHPNQALNSPCLHRSFKGSISGESSTLSVQGSPIRDVLRYRMCYQKAEKIVESEYEGETYGFVCPGTKFLACSAYLGVVKGAGIDVNRPEGISIADLEKRAREICHSPSQTGKFEPFNCITLSFVIAVLRDGHGFPNDVKLHFVNKIGAYDLGWSIGLALHEVSKHVERSK